MIIIITIRICNLMPQPLAQRNDQSRSLFMEICFEGRPTQRFSVQTSATGVELYCRFPLQGIKVDYWSRWDNTPVGRYHQKGWNQAKKRWNPLALLYFVLAMKKCWTIYRQFLITWKIGLKRKLTGRSDPPPIEILLWSKRFPRQRGTTHTSSARVVMSSTSK